MLRAEFKETLTHLKIAAPLAIVGLIFVGTAYLLITAATVALVAVFIDSTFRWFFALGGVGILWLVLGGVALYVAKREFELKRLMSLSDKKVTVLAKLFGGQGTINVPSWSPDSKQLAFVSYMLIPPDKE